MVKRSSDPQVAHPEVKVLVRDLVRVVGFSPPLPRGVSVFVDKSFYRAPAGRWAQETCAGCPQQRYITGEPGKVQGRDRVGIVEVSCGYRARRVSIRGKFVLSRNLGYKTRGISMWLNVVLTAQVAHPEVKVLVRDLVRVVGFFPPLPRGGSVFVDKSFYRAPAGRWAQETCAGCPQQRYITGEPGKVQGRDRVGIVEVSCGYRARRVSIRGKFVLSRNLGYKTRGISMWLNVVLTARSPTPKSKFRVRT